MTQGFLTATPFVLLFLLGFGEKAFLHLKKFILHGKSVLIENHTLIPLTSKPKASVARKGTPNNATGVIKYLVLITSAGIMTTAQMFSYMIQIPCFSCKIVFK